MSATRSPARFPKAVLRTLATTLAIAAIVAGCGGGDSSEDPLAGSVPVDDDTPSTSSADSPGIVDFDDFPVVGTDGYQGPDWMEPTMVVLLPDDLTVTLDYQDPDTGNWELTGFVSNGDIDELLGDAKFMIRAAGYFIGDDSNSGASQGFSAKIGPTDEQILFAVVDVGDGTVQWSMEYSIL